MKKVLQREKRKFMNELLRFTEQDYSQGNVRQFLTTIKKYKQFNPMLKGIKDKNEKILINPQAKVSR